MKVILKKRVPNLGHEWDVVTVKKGYARNFLLPQALASIVTPTSLKTAEKQMVERVRKADEVKAKAQEMMKKLAEVSLTFKMKAKGKKLYGSITEKDIAEAILKEAKIEINKEMVHMTEHLKAVGDHKVKIHLAEGVEATVGVKVEAEEKE